MVPGDLLLSDLTMKMIIYNCQNNPHTNIHTMVQNKVINITGTKKFSSQNKLAQNSVLSAAGKCSPMIS